MDNTEESLRNRMLDEIFRICRDNGWTPPTTAELAGLDSAALNRELTILEEDAHRKAGRLMHDDLFGFSFDEDSTEPEYTEPPDEDF